ncbi:MAG: S-adenosylmethionine:tRNA ribosyltransferase-isomerase [Nitriliruptorales bacterium]|nr:S-adenosylmethionine:tRNA ribosyltransferase-isomerase [Nitriliruptorales bacterium]
MTATLAAPHPVSHPHLPSPHLPSPPSHVTAGALDFVLPPEREAHEPAEARGRSRDDVRLLVASRHDGRLAHAGFRDLPSLLDPGDLLVINTSKTIPAALPARMRGWGGLVHLSTRLPGGLWLVELRRRAGKGSRPEPGARPGWRLRLPAAGALELLTPYPVDREPGVPARLWVAILSLPGGLHAYLAHHGQPIRYLDTPRAWPLEAYQTVYATEPGSAELPSAGRAFTPEVMTALVARGVGVTPLVLHTGVSSPEAHEPPYPEWYQVPVETADRVNAVRAACGRVVAVGTTVIRALETVSDERGRVHPGQGWTELVITPERGARAVDGLLTGWHEPRASHLALLEAVGGRALLESSYAAALDGGYRWHEFGDLHLLLP